MKLTKLALLVTSAIAVTACGGGGGDDEPAKQQNNTVTQQVEVQRYSSADIEALSVASSSATTVCLDTSNDGSCFDEKIQKTLDSGTGTVTLQWNTDEVDSSNKYIIAENSEFKYKVKASEGEVAGQLARKPLYINPVTDAATRFGEQELKAIVSYTGAANDFSPTKPLNDNLLVLADCIAKLTEDQTSPDTIYNEDEVKQSLEGVFTNIQKQMQDGLSPSHIVVNIVMGTDPKPNPNPENNAPIADFEITIQDNGSVKFVNNSTDADGDPLTYRWNFGDGSISTDKDPTHQYLADGTYNVTLIVTDGSDADSQKEQVTISNFDEDVLVFEPSFDVSVDGLKVVLTNTSRINGVSGVSYRWDFGDGSETSVEKNPTHTYTESGSYVIRLQAVSADGHKKLITKTVTVKKPTDQIPDPDPEDPTIAATFTTSVSKLVVSFASNVSYTGDKSVTYSWDFGDGQTSTDAKPTHTYPQDGTYTVVLTVTDGTISNTYTKTVAVASDVTPSQPEIEATFTSSADNLKVSFEPKVNFIGEGTVKYSWDFGDGKKSTDEKPSHTYSKAGSYTVTLTVSAGDLKDVYTSEVTVTAGGEDLKPEVCPENDPYCKGEIDPAECQQTCETKEIEVCDDATTSSVKALSPSVSAVSAPIATTYYATNPNGQVGVEKTITSMSDWTSDMIIAQGAANDDPRAFRGYHEMATDFYALYAAYDDTNLYLMIEMPNLPMGFAGDSRVPEVGSDFDYSTSQSLPMGIGIRTGVRTAGTGLLDEGYNVWTKANVYTIEEGIDTLLMFHPNLKAGDPGLFKTNSDGLFTYTRTEGLLLGFKEAGIERVVEHTAKSANYWGLPNNYGKDATFYTAESDYQNLLKGDASGHLYQITIPLASIDITKDHIKNNGIAVMTFSTFGESMMDALPWTPNLVDKASEAYSKDVSTSAEKEDVDVYDVPLARIGKTELEPPVIVPPVIVPPVIVPPVINPPVEDNCRKETVTVCTPEVLPDSCSSTGSISVELTHVETSTDKQVETTVTVATGYKGVKYEWEVTGKEKVTTSYDETTKKFTFKKGTTAKDVTITVTAKNASGKKTGSKSFDLTIPACEGDACGTVVNGEWFSAQGVDTDNIKKYDTSNTCKAADGAVILKADVSSAPNAYIYKDETTITAAWPGDALTKVEGCTSTFYQSKSGILSSTVQVIFNEVGGDRYPAEMQPGVEMSAAASCFDWASKKAVSAEDCGLVSAPPADTAYILRNGKEVADGSTITITYKEDDPSTGYVDVSLMVYGTDTDESSEGTFTVDGQEATFVNGQILRIGENIEAAEDKASATPMTLVVKYGNDTKTYKFIKVKWTKPTATTQFTWNNALIYFVMTDRFYNADKTNDNNFGRTYKDATGHSTATFHGGDIKGMTERLDYIKSLGMNAIWITAPYEQAHGWTGGGKNGAFAHWGYHGYYALDFTSMDPNVGTVEEFRTFVKEAHKKGLRVILDIVMNHSGYATLRDMCDFSFGKTKEGWDYCTEWTPSGGQTWHNKPIDETVDSSWNGWWGKDWLRFGGYGGCGGDDLTTCTSYLPDFKNEANGPTVGIPAFLQKKWASSKAEYDIPAAKAYRSGNMSVADSIAHWLASWVEEFGIDGFRCDTAKHVQKETWGKLHKYSQEALQKWRSENAGGDDPAASWTQDFFMTGEHWGFGKDASDNDGYARVGGFTSMINFSLGCSTPGAGQWKEYASTYNNGTGAPKLNALTYVSSHDTALCRPSDMKALGTGLLLLPGGVQVYYGDETARPNDHGGSGNDEEHGTRSDMNFPSDIASQSEWAAGVDTLSTSFSSNETLAHWQKIGQFRYRNAAVGAGKQTETGDGSYCRTYANETEGINNSVVIHVGSASSVDVGSCFEDGTELQDAYSGATGTVSGGKVSLSGTGSVILLELKR